MAVFKCDWWFQLYGRGWKETWYQEAEDYGSALLRFVAATAAARVAMTGSPTRIIRSVVSNVAFLNESNVNYTRYTSGHGDNADDADQPNASIYCLVKAGDQYSRSQQLRGVPDDWIKFNAGGAWDRPAYANTMMTNWRAAALAAQLRIRVWDKNPGVSPTKDVIDITEAPVGRYVITIPAHGYQNLDRVQVWGARGTNVSATRGTFQVFNRTADTFEIPVNVTGPVTYLGFAKAKKKVYLYPLVTDISYARPSTRRTGAPPGTPRGRRKSTPRS